MLFPEEDSEHLKNWIISRLKNTSDADPDVLADYMLALLRHDGDEEAVRALCEVEINNFLEEGSAVFVQDVFDAIHYKSYLPGASPPLARKPSLNSAPPTGPAAAAALPALIAALPGVPGMPGAPLGPQNGNRKRSYNDRGDGDAQDRVFHAGGDPNGRSYKQPRRGGMGGANFNNLNGRGGFQGRGGPANIPNFPGMPPLGSPPIGLPPMDANNPLAAILAMQQLGQAMGLPPIAPLSTPAAPLKVRCRDYDQKGYCIRGSSCKFDHGEGSVFVPPGSSMDEYDPTNSSLMTGVESNSAPNGSAGFQGNDRGRGRGGFPRGGGDRGGFSGPRRGGRAEFSSDRPNFDKSRTTIVVEQIPEEKFEESHIREFFSEFGNIVEVTMRPYKRLAIVNFDDYQSAKNAYDSPRVIFDNRFVKVYWYINPESLPQAPPNFTTKPSNGTKQEDGTQAPVPARQTSEPAMDPVEFAKKQEEAQKAHEEKMKKKQQVEAARLDLEERLKSQAEEKRQLLAKIAAMTAKKSGSPAAPAENGSPVRVEGQSEASKLLAKLEAEAQSLGLDTTLTDNDSWALRGRGRGRGGYRGRGSFVPRGVRGGYRGRGGAPFMGGNVYKLDNRPRKVGIKGVDFTVTEKQEPLREHLFTIDSTATLDISPHHTTILFKDRFSAEKFMASAPSSELPGVGHVELAWITTPLPIVKVKKEEDVNMEDSDAMAGTPNRERYEDVKGEVDYDVADDNEWNIS